jgi:hypothetical protein
LGCWASKLKSAAIASHTFLVCTSIEYSKKDKCATVTNN